VPVLLEPGDEPIRKAATERFEGAWAIDFRFGSLLGSLGWVRSTKKNEGEAMRRHRLSLFFAATAAALAISSTAQADMDAAKRWVEKEFQPSTLTREQQLKEMEWFINAAKPFKGMEINVLSETIPTHEYESKTLAKALEEITGIKVNHQLLGEGEVVQAVQTQMQTNRNLYDAYINDSDLIGTHSRLQSSVNLTDWMAGEGKDVTLPTLDVNEIPMKSFTSSVGSVT